MFMMGLEGGKPDGSAIGVQPEWFYKGDGSSIVGTGAPLPSPHFALDGGEESEIAGIYLIDAEGNPRRLGFCLANEFSDHVTERGNYLWLAHSKLRPAALGPELLTGDLPPNVRGMSRIVRSGATLWEKPFLTGEANMSHSIRNLEQFYEQYLAFRETRVAARENLELQMGRYRAGVNQYINVLQAIVSDDGCGFDVEATLRTPAAWAHLGLHGMRERAALAGGTVTIESTPGDGTTIYVRVPVLGGANGSDPDPPGG